MVLSILLAVVMALGMLPGSAFAFDVGAPEPTVPASTNELGTISIKKKGANPELAGKSLDMGAPNGQTIIQIRISGMAATSSSGRELHIRIPKGLDLIVGTGIKGISAAGVIETGEYFGDENTWFTDLPTWNHHAGTVNLMPDSTPNLGNKNLTHQSGELVYPISPSGFDELVMEFTIKWEDWLLPGGVKNPVLTDLLEVELEGNGKSSKAAVKVTTSHFRNVQLYQNVPYEILPGGTVPVILLYNQYRQGGHVRNLELDITYPEHAVFTPLQNAIFTVIRHQAVISPASNTPAQGPEAPTMALARVPTRCM